MSIPNEILKETLTLSPSKKAELIEKLLASLDEPDKEIEKLWAEETENRIDACEQGKIKSFTLREVLEKYK